MLVFGGQSEADTGWHLMGNGYSRNYSGIEGTGAEENEEEVYKYYFHIRSMVNPMRDMCRVL